MADIIYLTLNGNKQGLISAGCSSYDSIGNRYQNNHSDEILVYSTDYD
ncbi:type VI secretion system tube protein TssD, partial [Proteus mirabilis]